MSDPLSPRDWELLGVAPGASLDEVQRAYDRQRDLWSEGSLATYSLLEEGERTGLIAEIEAAWQRVRASLQVAPPPAAGSLVEGRETAETSPPDPAVDLGAFLRFHRLRQGMSLQQIAAITKIQPTMLDRLEREELHTLPPRVYVRGFVIQFARALGLEDAEGLAARFLARVDSALP